MTDRDYLLAAEDAIAPLEPAHQSDTDRLTRAIASIIAHLRAQQAAQEVASAPQTAPQAEAGQGDGGEAERAEAVRAVSTAIHLDACTDDAHDGCDAGDWTREAEIAIAAAEPHIRAKTLAEIEAAAKRIILAQIEANRYVPDTIGHLLGGYSQAAHIARQEQP